MASQQFQLDFNKRLPVSAQIGMKQADDHADDRWKQWVNGCIQDVARRKEFFTVDDVIESLRELPNPPDTHNLGALGPRMQKVSEELGYMTATNEHKRSRLKGKNGNLHRVWRSNIFTVSGATAPRA
jgi:hypothetical protein